MLTPVQESELVSGGDCFGHWHSSDRVVSHGDLRELQNLAVVYDSSGDVVVSTREDFILADTSSSNLTVSLPEARGGREIEVVKYSPANKLTVAAWGDNKILGADQVIVYNYGTSLRFKAIQGGWIII